jgi:hypothetical protein
MHRLVVRIGLVLAALLFGAAAAQAQQAAWTASQYTEQDGTRVGVLIYGVPETDDTTVLILCRAANPNAAEVSLFIDPGPIYGPGLQVPVYFASNTLTATSRMATIAENGMFGTYPQLTLAATDPLWQNLIHDASIDVAVEGQPWLTISLRGSANAIAQWAQICDSIAGIAPPVPAPGGKDGGTNASQYYVGTWQQVPAKGNCVSDCVLVINDTGGTLTVYSYTGWSAEIFPGADGDPFYATGTGAWITEANAGALVDVDIVASPDGASLQLVVSTLGAPPQTLNYVRQ